jgi:heptaprenyl diphosphate synthase
MRLLNTPELAQQMAQVEEHIRQATQSREAILARASARLAASGGKRLRPALVILGGAFGPEKQSAVLPEIAAAIELLHMATLVHDDIIDDSPTRRGEPTVQAHYGKDVAVFTGDFLLTKALLLLTKGKSDQRMSDLAKVMVHICEGEVGQYADRFRTASVVRYLKRIHGKTAALYGISLAAGAHQSGADEKTCQRLAKYGIFFGMAFQIYDDLLDYTASSQQLGKPVGYDVLSGVYTLPLLYALKDKGHGEALSELLKARQEVAASQVVDIVRHTNGLEQAQALLRRYVDKAMGCLAGLPDSEAKSILVALPGQLFKI